MYYAPGPVLERWGAHMTKFEVCERARGLGTIAVLGLRGPFLVAPVCCRPPPCFPLPPPLPRFQHAARQVSCVELSHCWRGCVCTHVCVCVCGVGSRLWQRAGLYVRNAMHGRGAIVSSNQSLASRSLYHHKAYRALSILVCCVYMHVETVCVGEGG